MKQQRRSMLALAFAALAACATGSHAADAAGWFGFAVSVETEGFSLNPTLQSAKVQAVLPASPAASAGVAPGDQIVAVDGLAVAGAKADALKAVMKKSVGQTLRLTVQRGGAAPVELPLVAVARPSGR